MQRKVHKNIGGATFVDGVWGTESYDGVQSHSERKNGKQIWLIMSFLWVLVVVLGWEHPSNPTEWCLPALVDFNVKMNVKQGFE